MNSPIRILKKDLKAGKALLVSVAGDDIVVFQLESGYVAVDNHCPHQHHSKLHEGTVSGNTVTCPMHGWSFDIPSGSCVNGSGKLKHYPITVRRDSIEVKHSDM